MNFKHRIQSWFQRDNAQKSFYVSNTYDTDLMSIRRALGVVDASVSEAYLTNDAVFAVVSRFVLAFQEPQLNVYSKTGEMLPKHPLRAVFSRPNPQKSESDLFAQIAQYWSCGGVCYLHKLRNKAGKVVGLRAFSASQVMPCYESGIATSFQINVAGKSFPVPVEDVIYIPFPVQDEEGRGIPPFLPAMMHIMTDSEATRYLYAVLKNDAVPRTVITQGTDLQLGNKERERVRDELAEAHGGLSRGRPLILPSGANIERISLSLQELTLDSLRKVPEARLCAALQIPPELVGLGIGLENSTYANKSEARKSYVESTLVPYWTYCAEAIERGLHADFGEDFELGFDIENVAALQESQDAKQGRAVAAFEKGLITRNEGRLMLGLPALPNQDVFFEQVQPQSAPALPSKPQKALPQGAWRHTKDHKAGVCGGEGCEGANCTNICPHNAEFYAKEIVGEWKSWDLAAEDFAQKLEKAINPVFEKLESEIASKIRRKKGLSTFAQKRLLSGAELFDLTALKEALQTATGGITEAYLLEIAQRAAEQVETSWDSIQDDYAKELATLFGNSIDKITGVSETVREQVREFLSGIAEKPIDEIVARFKEQFSGVIASPSRIRTIARTTATAATSGSQRTTWELAGFKVAWLTQRDGKVRAAHAAMDGKLVDDDGFFRYTDENGGIVEGQYPANMSTAGGSVNCRCYLRPVRK